MYDVQDQEYDVQRSHSVTSQRSHPPTPWRAPSWRFIHGGESFYLLLSSIPGRRCISISIHILKVFMLIPVWGAANKVAVNTRE